MNQNKEVRIDPTELRRAMAEDYEKLMVETTEAMNKARDGAIIADSEMIVREAMGRFRQKVYEKAVQMKADKAAQAAFPPSAQPGRDVAEGQGDGRGGSPDGQRHDSH